MSMLKRALTCMGVLALMVAWIGSTEAGQIYDFSFAGAGISGSGTFDADYNSDGTYTVISGTGTVIGAPNGEQLLTLYPSPNPQHSLHSPSGYFIYDNLYFYCLRHRLIPFFKFGKMLRVR